MRPIFKMDNSFLTYLDMYLYIKCIIRQLIIYRKYLRVRDLFLSSTSTT